ncbi:hypothetical protein A3Q56_02972 [Intoshia linei]|uniref:Uncharacterized protein n=1 Tax=Intoshia linei TaxID=1819745 RepID=A0A177B4T0_9BILA|nr:hypothetical protein A3Q56_02972 [Intoshia linei]
MTVRVGHHSTLLSFLTLVKYFDDSYDVTAENWMILENYRKFNTTEIIPFSSNVIFVLYYKTTYLKMLINQKYVKWPHLDDDEFKTVKNYLLNKYDECNYVNMCVELVSCDFSVDSCAYENGHWLINKGEPLDAVKNFVKTVDPLSTLVYEVMGKNKIYKHPPRLLCLEFEYFTNSNNSFAVRYLERQEMPLTVANQLLDDNYNSWRKYQASIFTADDIKPNIAITVAVVQDFFALSNLVISQGSCHHKNEKNKIKYPNVKAKRGLSSGIAIEDKIDMSISDDSDTYPVDSDYIIQRRNSHESYQDQSKNNEASINKLKQRFDFDHQAFNSHHNHYKVHDNGRTNSHAEYLPNKIHDHSVNIKDHTNINYNNMSSYYKPENVYFRSGYNHKEDDYNRHNSEKNYNYHNHQDPNIHNHHPDQGNRENYGNHGNHGDHWNHENYGDHRNDADHWNHQTNGNHGHIWNQDNEGNHDHVYDHEIMGFTNHGHNYVKPVPIMYMYPDYYNYHNNVQQNSHYPTYNPQINPYLNYGLRPAYQHDLYMHGNRLNNKLNYHPLMHQWPVYPIRYFPYNFRNLHSSTLHRNHNYDYPSHFHYPNYLPYNYPHYW